MRSGGSTASGRTPWRGAIDGGAALYTEDAIYKGSGKPPTEGRQARAA